MLPSWLHRFKIRHLRDSFAFRIILVKKTKTENKKTKKNFVGKSLDQSPLGAVVFGKLAENNVLLKLALLPFWALHYCLLGVFLNKSQAPFLSVSCPGSFGC